MSETIQDANQLAVTYLFKSERAIHWRDLRAGIDNA